MKGADVGDDIGLSGLKEVLGREVGDEFAFAKQDDAIAEVESFVEVVGHEKDGFLEAGEQIAKHVLHFRAGEGIEGSEGLVHEENGWIGGEGTGEADTLALTAGELMGHAGGEAGGVETNGLKEFVGTGNALAAGPALGFKQDGDVSFDVEVGE
jgi:hypothetical protein